MSDNKASSDLVENVEKIFATLDEKGVGYITFETIKASLETNPSLKELGLDSEELFQLMDSDKSGQVTKEEFVQSFVKSLDVDDDRHSRALSIAESVSIAPRFSFRSDQDTDREEDLGASQNSSNFAFRINKISQPKLSLHTGSNQISMSTIPSIESGVLKSTDLPPRHPLSPTSEIGKAVSSDGDDDSEPRSDLSNRTMVSGDWYIRAEIEKEFSVQEVKKPTIRRDSGKDDGTGGTNPSTRRGSDVSFKVETVGSKSPRNHHYSSRITTDEGMNMHQELAERKHETKMLRSRTRILEHECSRLENTTTDLIKAKKVLEDLNHKLSSKLEVRAKTIKKLKDTVRMQRDEITKIGDTRLKLMRLRRDKSEERDGTVLVEEIKTLEEQNRKLEKALSANLLAHTKREKTVRALQIMKQFVWLTVFDKLQRKIKILSRRILKLFDQNRDLQSKQRDSWSAGIKLDVQRADQRRRSTGMLGSMDDSRPAIGQPKSIFEELAESQDLMQIVDGLQKNKSKARSRSPPDVHIRYSREGKSRRSSNTVEDMLREIDRERQEHKASSEKLRKELAAKTQIADSLERKIQALQLTLQGDSNPPGALGSVTSASDRCNSSAYTQLSISSSFAALSPIPAGAVESEVKAGVGGSDLDRLRLTIEPSEEFSDTLKELTRELARALPRDVAFRELDPIWRFYPIPGLSGVHGCLSIPLSMGSDAGFDLNEDIKKALATTISNVMGAEKFIHSISLRDSVSGKELCRHVVKTENKPKSTKYSWFADHNIPKYALGIGLSVLSLSVILLLSSRWKRKDAIARPVETLGLSPDISSGIGAALHFRS